MNKDTGIIKRIIGHIENVRNAQKRFGDEYTLFVSDKDYFNSVCMSLLQMGELARHLTTEFTTAHADIPWKNIIGLRNVVVHGYGQLDTETVWSTLTDDLPELYRKCKIIESSA
ncbi:MAG: DUF86 domain-containing protein [Treponema sp.]|jgi:uncharacterized protein with HEPN domain|nr:DUF86 domain-containing protein [Treponema sp.]